MNDDDFGTKGGLQPILEFFNRQLGLLHPVPDVFRIQEGLTWSVVHPLLFSIGDTGNSILVLAPHDKLRDTFVLSRVLFETIVNACLIVGEGDSVAERSMRHAQQKTYRDLDRTVVINGKLLQFKFSGEVDIANDAELQAALAEFTSRRGREKSWIDDSISERVERIDMKYGAGISTMLQFGLLVIYQHSSEIAHGSLYGALLALGCTQPPGKPRSIDAMKRYSRETITMLLLVLGMCLDSLVQILSNEIKDDSLQQQSRKAIDALSNLPWTGSPVSNSGRT